MRAPRSWAIPISRSRISAVASASGSARWHGRASVTNRCASAPRFAGWRPSEPSGEPDRVDDGRGDPAAGQAHRLVVEERHVEPCVVRDQHGVAAELEEAPDARGDRRRAPQVGVPEPGQRGDRRLERRAGVRQRLEALGQLEPAHTHGADLAGP